MDKRYNFRLLLSIALLSLALLAYELFLIQFLSLVQWYHFAFMVISIALLGFGASGTLIVLLRKFLINRIEKLLPILMISSGLLMAVSIRFSRMDFVRFDSYLLFVDNIQIWRLFLNYLIFFLPFFCGALALGLVFVKHVKKIGIFYFADLTGAGLGGLLILGLLYLFNPRQIPLVIAFVPLISGLLIIKRRHRTLLSIYGLAVILILIFLFRIPFDLNLSQYKSLSRVMDLPDARIIIEKNSPYGFIQVVSSPALRYAPGLSLKYTGEVPVREVVFLNGNRLGSVPVWQSADTTHLLDYSTASLPYSLKNPNRVLILNAGTGNNISHALTKNVKEVVAVEQNRQLIKLLKHELALASDSLFFSPGLKIHTVDPRAFLASDTSFYDLIILPEIDAFGGTSGLFALSEKYLMTKEAVSLMWQSLNADGVIAITLWIDYPVRNPIKVLATMIEVLEENNVDHPLNYITAVRSWATITFQVKKSPYSEAELGSIKAFCRKNGFDITIMPGIEDRDRTIFNTIGDAHFFSYLDTLFSPGRSAFYNNYGFKVEPATDDRPYFSQFLKISRLSDLRSLFGEQTASFLELGYLILFITFIQAACLAILLILVPLIRLKRKKGFLLWTFVYFSGLGTGYMFIEIVLIHKFILYFGNPVYASALVIGCMLISSGAGSILSSRINPTAAKLQIIAMTIFVLLLIYAIFLTPLLQSGIGLGFSAKVLLSLVIIAVPAFIMGMPFPLGLRLLSDIQSSHIPWAWGINGSFSVISTSLAVIITVEAGFNYVMLLAALAYGLVSFAGFLLKKK